MVWYILDMPFNLQHIWIIESHHPIGVLQHPSMFPSSWDFAPENISVGLKDTESGGHRRRMNLLGTGTGFSIQVQNPGFVGSSSVGLSKLVTCWKHSYSDSCRVLCGQ